MNFLDKLERKLGRYAVPNLMRYLTILYGVGFVMYFAAPQAYLGFFALDPQMILKGQVWRLVTWLMYPPSISPFFGLLMIYVYYMLGNAVEHICGTFRFNFFLLCGCLMYILGAFLLYGLYRAGIFPVYPIMTPDNLNMTILLAYMALIPDAVFFLFFMIPIKARYLGVIYLAMAVSNLVVGGFNTRAEILIALLNFGLFYLTTVRSRRVDPSRIIRRMEARMQRSQGEQGKQTAASSGGENEGGASKIRPATRTIHRCAVCGRTEKDSPDLVFRYCTKCNGDYEYCQEHLYTHEHVK